MVVWPKQPLTSAATGYTGLMSNTTCTIEDSISTVLETYSNVHRGSGPHARVTTALFEAARERVLSHFQLSPETHVVIFCSPWGAQCLTASLLPGTWQTLTSESTGLALGVTAVAVAKRAMRRLRPPMSGGGTARLMGEDWIVPAALPDRFEPGTPAIVNIIAFSRALTAAGGSAARPAAPVPDDDPLHCAELSSLSGPALLTRFRETLVGTRTLVPAQDGEQPYVHLDNAASTPASGVARDAFLRTLRADDASRQSVVERVADICTAAMGASPDTHEVIFTANTTEAVNRVAAHFPWVGDDGEEPVLLTTRGEHSSNDLPWRQVPGLTIVRVDVDQRGLVDKNQLTCLLKEFNEEHRHGAKRIRLVAMSGASNVLGACNDLSQIGEQVRAHGARLLVDGAQMAAHRQIDMAKWHIDFLVFSGHKIYAPFGAGALIAARGVLHFSADEKEAMAAATPGNAAGIAALGAALRVLQRIGWDTIEEEERCLTAHLLSGLSRLSELTVYGMTDTNGEDGQRKLGVVAFDQPGHMASRMARDLGDAGIGVRAGCHCSHILVKQMLGVKGILAQVQRLIVTAVPSLSLPGVVRVSLGIGNTREDVDRFLAALERILRRSSGRPVKRPRYQNNRAA